MEFYNPRALAATAAPGSTPDTILFANRLFLFFNALDSDGVTRTWFMTSEDGTNWSTAQSLRYLVAGMGVMPKTSPSIAILGTTLYLFYTGNGGNGIFYSTTVDGKSWTAARSVTAAVAWGGAGMSVMNNTSPNAVVFKDTLYLFYTGSGSDGIWYTTTTDGTSWTIVLNVAAAARNMGVMPNTSGSAIVFQNKLFLFFTGSGEDGTFYTTTPDGQAWQPVQCAGTPTVPGIGRGALDGSSPNATIISGVLYLFYTINASGLSLTTTADGQTWTPVKNITVNGNIGWGGVVGSSAIEYLQAPYLFWINGGVNCSDSVGYDPRIDAAICFRRAAGCLPINVIATDDEAAAVDAALKQFTGSAPNAVQPAGEDWYGSTVEYSVATPVSSPGTVVTTNGTNALLSTYHVSNKEEVNGLLYVAGFVVILLGVYALTASGPVVTVAIYTAYSAFRSRTGRTLGQAAVISLELPLLNRDATD